MLIDTSFFGIVFYIIGIAIIALFLNLFVKVKILLITPLIYNAAIILAFLLGTKAYEFSPGRAIGEVLILAIFVNFFALYPLSKFEKY